MDKKKQLILLLFIGLFIVAGSVCVIYFVDDGGNNGDGDSVDISFDLWVVKLTYGTTGVFDRGDYIEVASYDFYVGAEAHIDLDPIIQGSFTYKIKSPDLTKIGNSKVSIGTPSGNLISIIRRGILFVEIYDITGTEAFVLMDPIDTEWHTVGVLFEIDGDNSVVSIIFDGNIVLDNFAFSVSVLHANRITCSGSRYKQVPNLTYLILESLVIS